MSALAIAELSNKERRQIELAAELKLMTFLQSVSQREQTPVACVACQPNDPCWFHKNYVERERAKVVA